jgi:hypothetical protein
MDHRSRSDELRANKIASSFPIAVTRTASTLYEAGLGERSRMGMRISHILRLKSRLHPQFFLGETFEFSAERLEVGNY